MEKEREELAVLQEQLETLRQRLTVLEKKNTALEEFVLENYGELEEAAARITLLERFRQAHLPAAYLYVGIAGSDGRSGRDDSTIGGGSDGETAGGSSTGDGKGAERGLWFLYMSRDGLEWKRLYEGKKEGLLSLEVPRFLRNAKFWEDGMEEEPAFRLQGTEKWLRLRRKNSDKGNEEKGEAGEASAGRTGATGWTLWLAASREEKEADRFLPLQKPPVRLPPSAERAKVEILTLREYRGLTQVKRRI